MIGYLEVVGEQPSHSCKHGKVTLNWHHHHHMVNIEYILYNMYLPIMFQWDIISLLYFIIFITSYLSVMPYNLFIMSHIYLVSFYLNIFLIVSLLCLIFILSIMKVEEMKKEFYLRDCRIRHRYYTFDLHYQRQNIFMSCSKRLDMNIS